MNEYRNLLDKAYNEMPEIPLDKQALMAKYPGYKDVIQLDENFFTYVQITFSGEVPESLIDVIFTGKMKEGVDRHSKKFEVCNKNKIPKNELIEEIDDCCKNRGIHALISFQVTWAQNDVYIPKSQRIKYIFPDHRDIVVGSPISYLAEVNRRAREQIEKDLLMFIDQNILNMIE